MTTEPQKKPVLYVVVCAAPPVKDLPVVVAEAVKDWDVYIIASAGAVDYAIDWQAILVPTGRNRIYSAFNSTDDLPLPNGVLVAPATFNTFNKLAAGISDSLALSLVNEAIGLKLPVTVAPSINQGLVWHPAFRRSLEILRSDGVNVIFDPEKDPIPHPHHGPQAAELFPWNAVMRNIQYSENH